MSMRSNSLSLSEIVGSRHVLTDPADMAPYLTDCTGAWTGAAMCVVRPGTTEEVARVVDCLRLARIPITVQSGNTSVAGGSVPDVTGQGVVLSLGRMNKIRRIDTDARAATVDGGVIIAALQDKVAEFGLSFPLVFGASGSAMIGGALSANAGGANVLRYGNARDLCLGIEAVLPSGAVVNGLGGLRKDNTGYDLKNLLIGAEGTLGVITGAVMKLVPLPKIRVTAFLALSGLDVALDVLNALQDATGGLVEAFEWLPGPMVEAILAHDTGLRAPLTEPAETGILVEVSSTRNDDAEAVADGGARLEAVVFGVIEALIEQNIVVDGFFAASEQQRQGIWRLREAVLETLVANGPFVTLDAAVPLASVPDFVLKADACARSAHLRPLSVGHLGDGNIHYGAVARDAGNWDPRAVERFKQKMMEIICELNGTFSAEHGIGRAKIQTLAALKDQAQLEAMRAVKAALDPDRLFGRGVLF